MQNLIKFLVKYGYLGLFLLLEFVCFTLIVRYNQSQKEIWIHSAELYAAKANTKSSNINEYFDLRTVNDSISQENSELIEQILNYKIYVEENSFQEYLDADTLGYQVVPARVSSKVINYRNNFITLNKGKLDGITPDMGVITHNGIIGTIIACSDHYSKVMLVLNNLSEISSSIVGTEYFGNLKWDTRSNKTMSLYAVPKYAAISVGDTVVTSGYSTIFPKGIMIGKVAGFDVPEGSNNYKIDIDLNIDPTLSDRVYIIKQLYAEEERMLLESREDEL